MTSRSKNSMRSYEAEIEKNREESNWKKVADLAQQLKARSPLHESLAHFLIGEGKLEAYLEEWPPIKENIERAQRELSDARGYLTLATDDIGKKAGVALDAFLLLGKLNYACGAYEDALKNYKLAELDNLTEKELPVRSLRIVAESYAIKGLCLEVTTVPSSTSRYKQAERESEMIRSFDVSSELSLLYLQRAGAAAGVLLETALQRAPLQHMRAGRLHDAIDRYREMLAAAEAAGTQSLRLALARQLAEVLRRGVTGEVYKPPHKVVPPPQSQGTLTRRREEYVSEGPWKPKKYAGLNQFVPANEYEEMMLLLLVGEAMAVRDAVLSQSAEFHAARAHSLRNAAAVTDLLAVLAARWGQHRLLLESLERAMKFSFGSGHVWRQRALATAAAALLPEQPPLALAPLTASPAPHPPPPKGGAQWGASVRARGVARRAAALRPRDVALRLLAADTCYRAAWIEDGLEFAQEALEIAERAAEEDDEREEDEEEREEKEEAIALLSRCYLYCGIGHQMKAEKTNCRLEKESSSDAALALLVRAVRADDNDARALVQLAACQHWRGAASDAAVAARAALALRPDTDPDAVLLAARLARGAPALAAARLACHHQGDAALAQLARLQLRWEGGEAALATGKRLLRALHAREDDAASDRDAASASGGGWRGEGGEGGARGAGPLSAVSAHSARSRSPLAEARAHAWLLLADLCLSLERVSAAAGCVSEAAALTPCSHLVFYMRGMVQAACGECEEARQCFQDALAIHPTHLDSMLQLGATYYSLGWLRLAERALRAAGALAPARADTWRRLALVLAALGEPSAAADAAAAALALAAPPECSYNN